MSFFKSKFFVVLLVIAICFITVSSVLSFMGKSFIVRNTLNFISLPFRYTAKFVADGISGFADYFSGMHALIEENRELKDKIDELENEAADSETQKVENERLKEYLELDEKHPNYYFSEATVIGYEASNYMTLITLNAGSLNGIKEGMAIVTPKGIVGYVKEVGLGYCKALTIIDSHASAGAYSERGGALGIVQGNFELSKEGLCCMKNIKAEADIKAGDKILSSGVGSVYPEGFVIGSVVSVEKDSVSRTQKAVIKPSCDFENLSKVMIILGVKE